MLLHPLRVYISSGAYVYACMYVFVADFARLRLLNSKIIIEHLSADETAAIARYDISALT